MKEISKKKRQIPFDFVLEALEDLNPTLKPMFGCWAVYVGEKIVIILREKSDYSESNGVWVATTPEHHASLRSVIPSLRSIELFGPGETGWQLIPPHSRDFEESIEVLCRLIRQGDPRVGKIPKRKKPKRSATNSKQVSKGKKPKKTKSKLKQESQKRQKPKRARKVP